MSTTSPPVSRTIELTATEVRILRARQAVIRRPVDMDQLQASLPERVASEGIIFLAGKGLVAGRGVYAATMNPYGAVCVKVGDKELGVKPGEFHMVCPFGEGTTEHVRSRQKPSRTSGTPWRIIPAQGSEIVGLELWRTDVDPSTLSCGIRFGVDGAFVAIPNTPEARARWDEAHESGDPGGAWRSAATMPAWASRLRRTLRSVMVEKVGSAWQWAITIAGPETSPLGDPS